MPTIIVKGMTCGHCTGSVQAAVEKIPGLKAVAVSLEKGEVTWQDADASAPVAPELVKNAVRGIGFDAA